MGDMSWNNPTLYTGEPSSQWVKETLISPVRLNISIHYGIGVGSTPLAYAAQANPIASAVETSPEA